MQVIKRDGKQEPVAFDKITARIKKLCYGFDPKHVEPIAVAQKVVLGVYDGVTTSQLDDLASETAAYLTTLHSDYGRLAARIAVSNLHKNTSKSFSETMCAPPNIFPFSFAAARAHHSLSPARALSPPPHAG